MGTQTLVDPATGETQVIDTGPGTGGMAQALGLVQAGWMAPSEGTTWEVGGQTYTSASEAQRAVGQAGGAKFAAELESRGVRASPADIQRVLGGEKAWEHEGKVIFEGGIQAPRYGPGEAQIFTSGPYAGQIGVPQPLTPGQREVGRHLRAYTPALDTTLGVKALPKGLTPIEVFPELEAPSTKPPIQDYLMLPKDTPIDAYKPPRGYQLGWSGGQYYIHKGGLDPLVIPKTGAPVTEFEFEALTPSQKAVFQEGGVKGLEAHAVDIQARTSKALEPYLMPGGYDLSKFVSERKAQGMSEASIKSTLVGYGFKPGDVSKVFKPSVSTPSLVHPWVFHKATVAEPMGKEYGGFLGFLQKSPYVGLLPGGSLLGKLQVKGLFEPFGKPQVVRGKEIRPMTQLEKSLTPTIGGHLTRSQVDIPGRITPPPSSTRMVTRGPKWAELGGPVDFEVLPGMGLQRQWPALTGWGKAKGVGLTALAYSPALLYGGSQVLRAGLVPFTKGVRPGLAGVPITSELGAQIRPQFMATTRTAVLKGSRAPRGRGAWGLRTTPQTQVGGPLAEVLVPGPKMALSTAEVFGAKASKVKYDPLTGEPISITPRGWERTSFEELVVGRGARLTGESPLSPVYRTGDGVFRYPKDVPGKVSITGGQKVLPSEWSWTELGGVYRPRYARSPYRLGVTEPKVTEFPKLKVESEWVTALEGPRARMFGEWGGPPGSPAVIYRVARTPLPTGLARGLGVPSPKFPSIKPGVLPAPIITPLPIDFVKEREGKGVLGLLVRPRPLELVSVTTPYIPAGVDVGIGIGIEPRGKPLLKPLKVPTYVPTPIATPTWIPTGYPEPSPILFPIDYPQPKPLAFALPQPLFVPRETPIVVPTIVGAPLKGYTAGKPPAGAIPPPWIPLPSIRPGFGFPRLSFGRRGKGILGEWKFLGFPVKGPHPLTGELVGGDWLAGERRKYGAVVSRGSKMVEPVFKRVRV